MTTSVKGLTINDTEKVITINSNKYTEDRDKWRKYVHGVANPRIEDG